MADLAAARARLVAAFRAEIPERYLIPDYAPRAGDYKRSPGLVVIDEVLPAIDDGTDVITAELRLEVPAGVGLPAAYQTLDDMVARVDAAMPINWLALDDWSVDQDGDPVAVLRATCTAIGQPTPFDPIVDGPDWFNMFYIADPRVGNVVEIPGHGSHPDPFVGGDSTHLAYEPDTLAGLPCIRYSGNQTEGATLTVPVSTPLSTPYSVVLIGDIYQFSTVNHWLSTMLGAAIGVVDTALDDETRRWSMGSGALLGPPVVEDQVVLLAAVFNDADSVLSINGTRFDGSVGGTAAPSGTMRIGRGSGGSSSARAFARLGLWATVDADVLEDPSWLPFAEWATERYQLSTRKA